MNIIHHRTCRQCKKNLESDCFQLTYKTCNSCRQKQEEKNTGFLSQEKLKKILSYPEKILKISDCDKEEHPVLDGKYAVSGIINRGDVPANVIFRTTSGSSPVLIQLQPDGIYSFDVPFFLWNIDDRSVIVNHDSVLGNNFPIEFMVREIPEENRVVIDNSKQLFRLGYENFCYSDGKLIPEDIALKNYTKNLEKVQKSFEEINKPRIF